MKKNKIRCDVLETRSIVLVSDKGDPVASLESHDGVFLRFGSLHQETNTIEITSIPGDGAAIVLRSVSGNGISMSVNESGVAGLTVHGSQGLPRVSIGVRQQPNDKAEIEIQDSKGITKVASQSRIGTLTDIVSEMLNFTSETTREKPDPEGPKDVTSDQFERSGLFTS